MTLWYTAPAAWGKLLWSFPMPAGTIGKGILSAPSQGGFMNRFLLVALFTLSVFPNLAAAVDIKNVRPCYAPFGANRLDLNLLPGDVLFITYDLEGLTIDPKTGKTNYETTLELLDANQKVL